MFLSKPFMIEFSGTPEAGKTTTIYKLVNMLRNENYNVEVLRESAELLPAEMPKGTFEANMWMHLTTQAGILRAVYSKANIVLIDRGLIDSDFYGQKYLTEKTCSKTQYDKFKNMFLKELMPDLFIAMMVTPEEAIKRRGGEGKLVNKEYIQMYNKLYLGFFSKIETPKELIITNKLLPCEMSKKVLDVISKYLP